MFETYQETQSPENRSRLQADYWASFVGTPAGETLFAGFYRCQYVGLNTVERRWVHTTGVDPVNSCDLYSLTRDPQLDDLAGRLVLDWGAGTRSWIQRADNQDKVVLELRRDFQEPAFPGFTRFVVQMSALSTLPTSWASVLSASRGVYLLTCPRTREQYVGSATGHLGFLGRWLSYASDGNGGNVGLRSRDPSDYQVSILEVAGSHATTDDILDLESLWKKKLQSREMGLNRN
ncbi:GIY-YIG nuclease family protein [Mongoliimonas terrestris]|uniref:GIY-YIG nuclease family protein n=1 Tax=Mongoliimonas terrestris TaxID=1709001 RepID=UPI001FD968B4|nr:GIY-YIG nuclease family protein [Mongoliimonas terrestris]